MAKLYVKRFRLIADGKSYGAGSVVELADAEAERLAKEAPEEFEVLSTASLKSEKTVAEQEEVKNKTAYANLKLVDLRSICKEKGLAYRAKDTKEMLIAAIEASEEAEEDGELLDGLPPINMGEVVK